MAFWGIEIKPGKSYTHQFDKMRGRLRISQATLGWGGSTRKTVLKCNLGNRSPILLCTLFPEKNESCPLHLEFEEDENITFSVVGLRSVHLTGYYLNSQRRHFVGGGGGGDGDGDESEPYGEDIGETDTERSTDDDSEDGYDYEDDFIDDGEPKIFPPSPQLGKEVAETWEEEKSLGLKGYRRHLAKQHQVSASDCNDAFAHQQQVKENVEDVVNKNTERRPWKKNKVIDSDTDSSPTKRRFLCNAKVISADAKESTASLALENKRNGVEDSEQSINSDQRRNTVNVEAEKLDNTGQLKRKRDIVSDFFFLDRQIDRIRVKGIEQDKKKAEMRSVVMTSEAGNDSMTKKEEHHGNKTDVKRSARILIDGGDLLAVQSANREVIKQVVGDEGSRKKEKKNTNKKNIREQLDGIQSEDEKIQLKNQLKQSLGRN